MRRNVAAFTERNAEIYPAYISVQEENGRYVLTARERGCGGAKIVVIEMGAEDLECLAFEILGSVDRR